MPKEMTVLEGINSLRSVRKFNPDQIPEDKLKIVLACASKAASGSNTQPWKFVVVRDAKVKSASQRTYAQNMARKACW
jgi:nitroreductase